MSDNKENQVVTPPEKEDSETEIQVVKYADIGDYTKLSDIDKEILKLKVANGAMSKAEIARVLGLHRNTVLDRMKRPAMIKALAALDKTAIEIIEEALPSFARKLVKLKDSEDDAVSARVSIAALKGRGILVDSTDVKMKGMIVNINIDEQDKDL